uniref:Pentraxin family member n=1 Tax=Oryzias melastigma TaxID=30732 RepID=A0A3B3CAK3_ORYME
MLLILLIFSLTEEHLLKISLFLCFSGTLSMRTVTFPYQTSHSYVEIIPMMEMELGAFTLCMQVATEITGKQKSILFAYRKKDNELNVWRELNGRYAGMFSTDSFKVPDLGPLNSHLCLTWDSRTGATNLFMDGRRSLTKFLRKGHIIPAGGKVFLGQDPDDIEQMQSGFNADECLVGEVSDVNLWDSVLSDTLRGNVINWETKMCGMRTCLRLPNPDSQSFC